MRPKAHHGGFSLWEILPPKTQILFTSTVLSEMIATSKLDASRSKWEWCVRREERSFGDDFTGEIPGDVGSQAT